jgi:hypothetical protein
MNGTAHDVPDTRSEAIARRSKSRSPGGTQLDGPTDIQDIPSEKLGFGEDMRALRVLDRGFKA